MYSKKKKIATGAAVLTYLKQRFPILPLAAYSVLTVLGIATYLDKVSLIKIFTLSAIYLLFLFHLRVLDEFKDYKYDKSHHADRPLQKGLVTLTQLKVAGTTCMMLILILGLFAASFQTNLLLYASLFYTYFMYREFFAGEKLREYTFVYLVSHELVFIPLFLYFYSAMQGILWMPQTLSDVSVLLYTILPLLVIEIGRKIKHRYDEQGHKTNDTYAYVWGQQTAIKVFASLIIFAGFLSLFILTIPRMLSLILLLPGIYVFGMSRKYEKFIIAYHMAITSVFAILIPLLLIV